VHLRRSKTDQSAAGDAIGIAATDPDDPFDAVAAWTRWRNRLASHVFHTGPGLAGYRPPRHPPPRRPADHQIDQHDHRPPRRRRPGRRLRRAQPAPGVRHQRAGAGADERAVQRHGRWASPGSMAPYIDEAERFADTNPTRYLTLSPTP
jgi:hypothetical protein